MENLTSRQAADRLDITVSAFHRLAARNDVQPVIKAPGIRGAMFWAAADVDALVLRTAS